MVEEGNGIDFWTSVCYNEKMYKESTSSVFTGTFDAEIKGRKGEVYSLELPHHFNERLAAAGIEHLLLETNPDGYENWEDNEILVSTASIDELREEFLNEKTSSERKKQIVDLAAGITGTVVRVNDGRINIPADLLKAISTDRKNMNRKKTLFGLDDSFIISPRER